MNKPKSKSNKGQTRRGRSALKDLRVASSGSKKVKGGMASKAPCYI